MTTNTATTHTAANNFATNIANLLSSRGYSVLRETVNPQLTDDTKWTITLFVAARGNDADVARFTLPLGDEVDEQGLSAVVDVKASQVVFKRNDDNGRFSFPSKNVDSMSARMALTQGLISYTGTYGPGVVTSSQMARIIVESMELADLFAKDI